MLSIQNMSFWIVNSLITGKALCVLDREDIPLIIRTAILHFYTGYIHPFYDGNGRFDRFVSAYLLAFL